MEILLFSENFHDSRNMRIQELGKKHISFIQILLDTKVFEINLIKCCLEKNVITGHAVNKILEKLLKNAGVVLGIYFPKMIFLDAPILLPA